MIQHPGLPVREKSHRGVPRHLEGMLVFFPSADRLSPPWQTSSGNTEAPRARCISIPAIHCRRASCESCSRRASPKSKTPSASGSITPPRWRGFRRVWCQNDRKACTGAIHAANAPQSRRGGHEAAPCWRFSKAIVLRQIRAVNPRLMSDKSARLSGVAAGCRADFGRAEVQRVARRH